MKHLIELDTEHHYYFESANGEQFIIGKDTFPDLNDAYLEAKRIEQEPNAS